MSTTGIQSQNTLGQVATAFDVETITPVGQLHRFVDRAITGQSGRGISGQRLGRTGAFSDVSRRNLVRDCRHDADTDARAVLTGAAIEFQSL